ncbi:hypothetical protein G7070_14145 [Propioniciclava coleopterorum]|uniref:Right handed beta helix domain-containing protein n=1 Tax=Propioniciclava coleopterorum TaxID=2714937 RepID=A0A6G7Y980_9ACTN|nr:right-handed parallel beta-helix repeat-containing protein [Propioniciclava coleopterorum]QIK73191.1 hypothetical protein G7070_14145 [Propioniciclava coleopterorum]
MHSALSSAGPGDTIYLHAGTYTGQFRASNNGSAGNPIKIQGEWREGVFLQTGSTNKGSGTALTITGDWWVVNHVTLQNSSKGVVLDGSNRTVLDYITVTNVGDEAVHFMRCSSDNELKWSLIQGTGKAQPGFGEGVYVGSSETKWGSDGYACNGGMDQSNNNNIHHNTIRDTTAEGADLKEGTYGGRLTDNLFERTGTSGDTSADSAIDVKGNYWYVGHNTIGQPRGANVDGIQTHRIKTYSNDGNVIDANTIWDYWSGYGIKVTNNAGNNVVTCSNQVPHMASSKLSNIGCS